MKEMVKGITNKRVWQAGVVLIFLAVISVCARWQQLYGERKVVIFPFEMIKELPEEPNWYEENAFDEILYYQSEEKEIQRWFDKISFKGIGVVNKSGDPICLMDFRSSSMYGLTFFQHDGNLVVVSSNCVGKLIRMEVLEKSIRKGDVRYCYSKEAIVDVRDCSYIDYDDNNTLYYYIEDGSSKTYKIDEEVVKVGFYSCNATSYPIIKKDNQLYSYKLEGAEARLLGEYSYQVEEINPKKVVIEELQGTCKIEKPTETTAEIISIEISSNEHEYFWFSVQGEGIKNLQEGEYEIAECFSILQKEGVTFKERRRSDKQYMYLDRSLGYDHDSFW